jgi:hypothetical protein
MTANNTPDPFGDALDTLMANNAADNALSEGKAPLDRLDQALGDAMHEQACNDARMRGEQPPLRPGEIATLQQERAQFKRDREFLMRYAGLDEDGLAEQRDLEREES